MEEWGEGGKGGGQHRPTVAMGRAEGAEKGGGREGANKTRKPRDQKVESTHDR